MDNVWPCAAKRYEISCPPVTEICCNKHSKKQTRQTSVKLVSDTNAPDTLTASAILIAVESSELIVEPLNLIESTRTFPVPLPANCKLSFDLLGEILLSAVVISLITKNSLSLQSDRLEYYIGHRRERCLRYQNLQHSKTAESRILMK